MKKRNRFAAAALAALLLAGSAPSALALDAIPPMYQQFGYDSAEEYMEQESYYGVFDYDTLSDHYRQHLDAVRSVLAFSVDGCALIHLLSTVNLLSMSLTSAARSYSTAVCIS